MTVRVLVTGAGGAAGTAVLRALVDHDVELVAVDCDPHAAGLYLTDEAPALVPRGDDPGFVAAVAELVRDRRIDVVIPTVDEELIVLARAVPAFAADGALVMVPSADSLARTLDKHRLVTAAAATVPCPRTELLDAALELAGWELPLIVKPRSGRGGVGVALIEDAGALAAYPHDGTWIVQELLPGEEYSVDTLVAGTGEIVAAVPRLRLKVDSGVAVTARTVHDDELERLAGAAVRATGLRGPANVQLRRDRAGRPRLLEINPRFPGTLAITIAAGVDLPWLALLDLLGRPLPPDAGRFADVALVRYLDDRAVDRALMTRLEHDAAAREPPDRPDAQRHVSRQQQDTAT
ncbi:MAG TPA: ATP-grasp domain-containing protein [Solirubrobacteraceae bacterium]